MIESVTILDEVINYSIQASDSDQKASKMYWVMLKGFSEFYYVMFRSEKVTVKKSIAVCEDIDACKVLGIHYSNVYERIVILFLEEKEKQLSINGKNYDDYTPYQSALWILLLNPSDGSYIYSQRILHSTSSVMVAKAKFDSLGKLNIILMCENCYMNGNAISSNIYLLQYCYIKTRFEIVKDFISARGNLSFTIHSLSVERDQTLTSVISSFNSVNYTIQDGNERAMQAQPNSVYLYRFRHNDGKIINIQKLSTEIDLTDGFIVSTMLPTLSTDNFVREQNPIFYTRRSPTTNIKELMIQSYVYYGNFYNNDFTYVSSSVRYGGSGGGNSNRVQMKVAKIEIWGSSNYIYSLRFTSVSGSSQYYGSGGNEPYKVATLDQDEYITEIHHDYRGYGFIFQSSVLACIKFVTNKKSISMNWCENGYVEYVPPGLELIGFELKYATCIDSISYMYGYSNTYSCASGYTGDNCQTSSCYEIIATNSSVCNGRGICSGPNSCTCSQNVIPSDSHNCLSYYYCNNIPYFDSKVCSGKGSCRINGSCDCVSGFYGNDCQYEAVCYGLKGTLATVCSGHGRCLKVDECTCDKGYSGANCGLPICKNLIADDPKVCSGHGNCTQTDVCLCETDFKGSDCEIFSCFDISNDNSSVCSGFGKCVDKNKCDCYAGYHGEVCNHVACYGIDKYNPSVCSSRGNCIGPDQCHCQEGYEGANCENFKCFGQYHNERKTCSGVGKCISINNCECNAGYSGSQCEHFECFGNSFNSSEVCSSGHGKCISPNNCECLHGFIGSQCELKTCFGIISTNTSVCSGHGTCVEVDSCNCKEEYIGVMCQIPTCYGEQGNSSKVCSGHGSCSDHNQCSCNPGYSGDYCQFTSCFGINSTLKDVCNGKGNCYELDSCNCTNPNEWFGEECGITKCFHLDSNDPYVCAKHGECIGLDICSCFSGYKGLSCEKYDCNSISIEDEGCLNNGTCHEGSKCHCTIDYTGDMCENSICFGFPDDHHLVCNGHGKCNNPNNCTCRDLFGGPNCNITTCFGLLATNPSVCSGYGACVDIDECICRDGHVGSECEIITCDGKSQFDPMVCSSNGYCSNPNECTCHEGFTGTTCQFYELELKDDITLQSLIPLINSSLIENCLAFSKVELFGTNPKCTTSTGHLSIQLGYLHEIENGLIFSKDEFNFYVNATVLKHKTKDMSFSIQAINDNSNRRFRVENNQKFWNFGKVKVSIAEGGIETDSLLGYSTISKFPFTLQSINSLGVTLSSRVENELKCELLNDLKSGLLFCSDYDCILEIASYGTDCFIIDRSKRMFRPTFESEKADLTLYGGTNNLQFTFINVTADTRLVNIGNIEESGGVTFELQPINQPFPHGRDLELEASLTSTNQITSCQWTVNDMISSQNSKLLLSSDNLQGKVFNIIPSADLPSGSKIEIGIDCQDINGTWHGIKRTLSISNEVRCGCRLSHKNSNKIYAYTTPVSIECTSLSEIINKITFSLYSEEHKLLQVYSNTMKSSFLTRLPYLTRGYFKIEFVDNVGSVGTFIIDEISTFLPSEEDFSSRFAFVRSKMANYSTTVKQVDDINAIYSLISIINFDMNNHTDHLHSILLKMEKHLKNVKASTLNVNDRLSTMLVSPLSEIFNLLTDKLSIDFTTMLEEMLDSWSTSERYYSKERQQDIYNNDHLMILLNICNKLIEVDISNTVRLFSSRLRIINLLKKRRVLQVSDNENMALASFERSASINSKVLDILNVRAILPSCLSSALNIGDNEPVDLIMQTLGGSNTSSYAQHFYLSLHSNGREIFISNLSIPILVTFFNVKIEHNHTEITCNYWSFESKTWSSNYMPANYNLTLNSTNYAVYDIICEMKQTGYIRIVPKRTRPTPFTSNNKDVKPSTSMKAEKSTSSIIEKPLDLSIILASTLVPGICFLLLILLAMIIYFNVGKKFKKRSSLGGDFEIPLVDMQDSSFTASIEETLDSTTNSSISSFDPLQKYDMICRIGQGGFGSVYKVRDKKLNEIRAVKAIRYSNNEELNNIMKEGMQLMNICHPHILKVNDIFIGNSKLLYIDMEYYENGDLSKLITENSLVSENIILQIMTQMCNALHFVHSSLQVIHRDVKPSNIFIKSISEESINVILADFGLAKQQQGSMSYAGTPLYMS